MQYMYNVFWRSGKWNIFNMLSPGHSYVTQDTLYVQSHVCIVDTPGLFHAIWLFVLPTRNSAALLQTTYHKTSNISRIKSQNLNVSNLVLQLSLLNPFKLGVKSRMKM